MTEAEMVAHLSGTGRYRILQKLAQRQIATIIRPEFPLRGVILDTETTGLNHRKEEIIEIGLIALSFDQAGAIGDITGAYGGHAGVSPLVTKSVNGNGGLNIFRAELPNAVWQRL